MDEDVGIGYRYTNVAATIARTVGRDSTKRARRAAKRGIGGKREGGGSRL